MPDDPRITEIDRDLVQLKVANATLAVNVANLAQQTASLQQSVQELNNTMNRGRGALWGITLIAGTAGASAVALLKKVFGT